MPNTIAQNLARLVASKTAIAQAITEKGGTVGETDGFEEFPIAIGTIPAGGGGNATFADGEGEFIFSEAAIESITIPDGYTSIGYQAFMYSTLSSVTIGDSIESIGDFAFQECSSLSSVTIGNSVESIGEVTFEYCTALSVIEFLSLTPPEIQSDTFGDLSTECIIYVPNGTLSDYTSAEYYPDPSVYTYIERPAT